MKLRIVSGFLGMTVILGITVIGDWPLLLALWAVSCGAFFEYGNMLKKLKVNIYRTPALLALTILFAGTSFYSFSLLAVTEMGILLLLLFMIVRIEKENLTSLVYTVFGVIYIGTGFTSLVLLRNSHIVSDVTVNMETGLFLLLFAFLGTWASDSFSYFVGKYCGKHSMAPHISPNKTMEGLAGGAVGSVMISALFSFYAGYPLASGGLMGLAVAIAAPAGDLFESFLKRACGVKDSGKIIPGHGGILDRFDSLLFVAPVMIVFLHICV